MITKKQYKKAVAQPLPNQTQPSDVEYTYSRAT